MKKLFGIGAILASATLLTACGGSGNTYTCSQTVTEDGQSMTQAIITHLDSNDKVESYDIEYKMSSKESADLLYKFYSSVDGVDVSQSGNTIKIKNAQNMGESEIDLVGMTKDEVKDFLTADEPSITCK